MSEGNFTVSLGDIPTTWESAAQRLGEELATVGPDGYYNFSPAQWLEWALAQIVTIQQQRHKWLAAFNQSEQFQNGPTKRAEQAEAARDKLLVALRCVLDSAVPNPKEHPTMTKSWKFANEVIASVEKEPPA